MKKQMLALLVAIMVTLASTPSFATSDKALEGVINVNTATKQELMVLPGIGDKRAELIIAARTGKPLAGNEELLAIPGIGEKMMSSWGAHVVFNGETTLQEKSVVPVKQ